jgi:hypothetical protein
MPVTPRHFRLSEEHLAKIDELGKVISPLCPLSRTDVIRVAITRLHAALVKPDSKKERR